jgi:hypothetical protein
VTAIEDRPYSCPGSVVAAAVKIPGQALNPRTVWFAGLEADAFDLGPDLLESVAETEPVGIDQVAPDLNSAKQDRGWAVPGQALEPWQVRFAFLETDAFDLGLGQMDARDHVPALLVL